MMRRSAEGIALILMLGVLGCAAPVGIQKLSPRDLHQLQNAYALTAGHASDTTQIVMRRYNLTTEFDEYPQVALARLRELMASGVAGDDEVFALAEMSYLYAQESDSRSYFLASALYAYAFLFPDDASLRPSPIDPRYRWACDLYAAGLVEAFRDENGKTIDLAGGPYPLPFGTLDVSFDRSSLVWGTRLLTDFLPTQEYEVEGMLNRYRHPGIGVPVAASTSRYDDNAPEDLIGTHVKVPATVLLRIDHPRQQIIDGGELKAQLDLLPNYDHESVEIDGKEVPLEIDRTAAIAVTLTESRFWSEELSIFLGDALGVRRKPRLILAQPYVPGKIPVVFVHGTASSPARWADMQNDLLNDARIRNRYQFWFFAYDSGNPIAYSAMLLRRALRDAVARFDPDGKDPCIEDMVVIGHSQGGLLTKMTAIDSGNAFWENLTTMPFDQVRISDSSKVLLKEALFVQPLPSVKRVVFISTPHQGSYLAGPEIVRRLAAKLISMPRDIVGVSTDLVGVRDPTWRMASLQSFPTSIDNMSPGQPFIQTLSKIPVSPGVHAHSIIPVEGFGPLDQEADGVVKYSSAHIEPVDSEKVICPSSHSTQSNPETVDEVRRILLLHAQETQCSLPGPADTSPQQPAL